MLDEFTNSNAESEHASLKKKSLGVVANQKMSTLYEKADMNSTQKSQLRLIQQHKDIDLTNVNTQCALSNYLVKCCYDELVKRLNYAYNNLSLVYIRKKEKP